MDSWCFVRMCSLRTGRLGKAEVQCGHLLYWRTWWVARWRRTSRLSLAAMAEAGGQAGQVNTLLRAAWGQVEARWSVRAAQVSRWSPHSGQVWGGRRWCRRRCAEREQGEVREAEQEVHE